MLNSANADQIVSAGDQLCLVGGAKRSIGLLESPSKKISTTIINAHPEAILLTVGKNINILNKKGNVSKLLESPTKRGTNTSIYASTVFTKECWIHAIALLSGILGYAGFAAGFESAAEDGLIDEQWPAYLGFSVGGVAGLVGLLMIGVSWWREFLT